MTSRCCLLALLLAIVSPAQAEDALDAGPFSDERLAALREPATQQLNIAAGELSLGCPVELHPVVRGANELKARDAIGRMNARLAVGSRRALREARWIGEQVVNREALLPLQDEECTPARELDRGRGSSRCG